MCIVLCDGHSCVLAHSAEMKSECGGVCVCDCSDVFGMTSEIVSVVQSLLAIASG